MWPFKKQNNDVIIYNKEMQQADGYLGVILNTISTIRKRLGGGTYGFSPDGKRNYNELFGYGEDLSYTDYLGMYRRGGIANAVVRKLPKACWREIPKIMVGEKEILKEELEVLKTMGFLKALERADIINRIGNFSVLLIGLPDSTDLNLPLGSANTLDGSYFNPYSYDGIEITRTDTDPASPRFGLPIEYQVRVTNIDRSKRKSTTFVTHIVHYTRIIHLAEGALDSSIEGASSLEPVWNALIDKDKVRGGSGEAFFRNARQKLSLEAVNGAQVATDNASKAALKENVEDFQNGWDDVLRLNNMKANMLQPGLSSPKDSFEIAVEEISGTTGIPIRILTGKGGGQTTGSEDKASWNSLITDRQDQDCSIWLLRGLGIFAEAGIFDLPDNAKVVWPVQKSLNEKEASETARNKAQAFKAVMEALIAAGGDIDAKSAFEAIGLEEIEVDDSDPGDDDDDLDKSVK